MTPLLQTTSTGLKVGPQELFVIVAAGVALAIALTQIAAFWKHCTRVLFLNDTRRYPSWD